MTVRRSGITYADFSGSDANFVIGCTPVSEGCANCYARELIERYGRDFSQVRIYPDKLKRLKTARFEERGIPFRRGPGSRPLIFPGDLGDLFHPDVPDGFIEEALLTMARRQDADWLILTKRPERMLDFSHFYNALGMACGWPPNLWPGVTVENSNTLWRIEYLVQISASVRWLSIEPLLEPIDLSAWLRCPVCGQHEWDWYKFQAGHLHSSLIDWIIVGAESGPNRRPFDENWAHSIRDQCVAVNAPFFYKQGSHRFPGHNDTLDGRQWKQFPR